MLDELPSGLSYRAAGCEFHVSVSTVYQIRCLETETHIQQGYILII